MNGRWGVSGFSLLEWEQREETRSEINIWTKASPLYPKKILLTWLIYETVLQKWTNALIRPTKTGEIGKISYSLHKREKWIKVSSVKEHLEIYLHHAETAIFLYSWWMYKYVIGWSLKRQWSFSSYLTFFFQPPTICMHPQENTQLPFTSGRGIQEISFHLLVWHPALKKVFSAKAGITVKLTTNQAMKSFLVTERFTW